MYRVSSWNKINTNSFRVQPPFLLLRFHVVLLCCGSCGCVRVETQLRHGYKSLWNAFSDRGCPQPVLLHSSPSRRKHFIETFPGNIAVWFWLYFAICRRSSVSFFVFRLTPWVQKKNKPEESVLFISIFFNPWYLNIVLDENENEKQKRFQWYCFSLPSQEWQTQCSKKIYWEENE